MADADEDEIDILSEFSFNSCLAQNNQGIPSCSDREDTVHPQWLLDSVSGNWYDQRGGPSRRLLDSVSGNWYDQRGGPSRRVTGNKAKELQHETVWSKSERLMLAKEMAKYGRDVRKISQTIKSKTEAEIQALIEAEHGIHLDNPSELDKLDDDNVPSVAHEEIITEAANINNVMNLVTTASPTVPEIKTTKIINTKAFTKKTHNTKVTNKNFILIQPITNDNEELLIDSAQILYEDELTVGSTESVGNDVDPVDTIMQKMAKQQRAKVKKLGNHRRKVSRNYDNGKRNKSQEKLSPGRQRKDSSRSEENTKSPKMQIVLGSGQALPVSEGEVVIKIKKTEDASSESDIEIDVDSDTEAKQPPRTIKPLDTAKEIDEAPIAVPLAKLELPRRQKKINLDGDGGYTIMHTAEGDVYTKCPEPKKERAHKPHKPKPVPLIHCTLYSSHRPAPFEVHLYLSALLTMDAHAHTSRAEVMGLIGGRSEWHRTVLLLYRWARAAASGTHCDMEPVSQASAAEHISSSGLTVCAWHHSHPRFPPEPSALDLVTQRSLQRALEREHRPLLGIITSQHWPPGRTASQYRCLRVENPDDDTAEVPTGYQFSVKLVPDLTAQNLSVFLRELHSLVRADRSEHSVDMVKDQCPQANCTYLEKYISSVSHHLRSAGYRDEDPFIAQIIDGIRDVFR